MVRPELQGAPFEGIANLGSVGEDLIVGLPNQRNKTLEVADESQPGPTTLLLAAIEDTLGGRSRGSGPQQLAESENTLSVEMEAALANRQKAEALVKALFPNGIPRTIELFQRLNDFQMNVGWKETSTRLAGALLCGAIELVSAAEGEALLAELPRVGNPGFFQTLGYLGVLLREQQLRAQFAADWFPSLVRRIGNDWASGDFWKALEGYCEHHPRNALGMLHCLLVAHDEEQISIVAHVLGTLRSLDLDSELRNSIAAIESEFSNSATPGPRAGYYRSWIQTAWRGKIENIHLEVLLSRMSAGTIDEREQAFGIVCRSLLSPLISPDCFELGMAWLLTNVSSALSPIAKYHVVDFAAQLRTERASSAAALILAVQPVSPEHKGIWQRIEHLLVTLLEQEPGAFRQFFAKFARANAANWLEVLNTARQFEGLLSLMRGRDVTTAVGQLVFDEATECRKLGLFFFDDLDLATLPPDLVEGFDEHLLALAFYESQRTLLHARANARLLVALIPRMERAGTQLQSEFFDELVLQLKNYPGGCREEFQRRARDFAILEKAVAEFDGYLEKLKRARDSGIVAMEVAGFRQAARLHGRRLARAVSKGAEEMSVIMKMFKNVRLLYGKEWSTFHDGKLSESSGLQEFSSSTEMPRMEFVDPEGMNLRRYQASVKIRELSKTFGKKGK